MLVAILVVLPVGGVLGRGAAAAEAPERVLIGVELTRDSEVWQARVEFAIPVRYLRHSPTSRGRLVEIQLEPLAEIRGVDSGSVAQVLKPPPSPETPLRDLRFEAATSGGPTLVATFSRAVGFSVTQGRDYRSLVIRIAQAKPSNAARGAAASGDSGPEALMRVARTALVAREYPRAIALYTKILSAAEGAHSREALEYLGLARQRNGQAAHARAEYETYLERYPEGAGAARVRQRLEVLRTARAAPRKKLQGRRRRSRSEFNLYGSISSTYQRAQSMADISGATLLDSSQIGDLDVTGTLRRGRFDGRVRFDGYYRYDFLASETGRGSRIRYLNLELRDRIHQLAATLGRQPGRGSGLLGRFDGLTLGWRFHDRWKLAGAMGFPQDSFVTNGVQTSRSFYGTSLAVDHVFDRIDGEIYAVGQVIEGEADRIALGAELRYIDTLGSLFATLDYDAYFASLNLAMLSGSLKVTPDTTLNWLVDHRNSPFLTTRNALIGQGVLSIGDLKKTFPIGDIEQLARDRTARTTTVMLGGTQRLTARWQLAGDFTATTYTSTPGSGGVASTAGTGWEYFYFLELLGSDLLLDGDLGRVGLRIFDGAFYKGYTLLLRARIPGPGGLRVSPILSVDYRHHSKARDRLALRPGVRVEYRWRSVVFDSDVRMDWLESVGGGLSSSSSDALGYTLYLGLRYDF